MSTTLATITSSPAALPGQKARSSWADAEFRVLSSPTTFTLNVNGGANGLSFDLVQDVSGGIDRVVLSGARSGATVKLETGKAYYIANPKNSENQSFKVDFLAAV